MATTNESQAQARDSHPIGPDVRQYARPRESGQNLFLPVVSMAAIIALAVGADAWRSVGLFFDTGWRIAGSQRFVEAGILLGCAVAAAAIGSVLLGKTKEALLGGSAIGLGVGAILMVISTNSEAFSPVFDSEWILGCSVAAFLFIPFAALAWRKFSEARRTRIEGNALVSRWSQSGPDDACLIRVEGRRDRELALTIVRKGGQPEAVVCAIPATGCVPTAGATFLKFAPKIQSEAADVGSAGYRDSASQFRLASLTNAIAHPFAEPRSSRHREVSWSLFGAVAWISLNATAFLLAAQVVIPRI